MSNEGDIIERRVVEDESRVSRASGCMSSMSRIAGGMTRAGFLPRLQGVGTEEGQVKDRLSEQAARAR